MKIIDLLNKIANDEELPKKFVFEGDEFYLLNDKCYKCDERNVIFEEVFIFENLNDEIEIIEEKKIPEKIDTYVENDEKWIQVYNYGTIPLDKKALSSEELVIIKTLNQIIDYLKSKGE